MKKTRFLFLIFVSMIVRFTPLYAQKAAAQITPPSKDSALSGQVTFEDTLKGLKVTADLAGAPPGVHGFHIHEHGSCEDAGKAAGDHFNPDGRPHGDLAKDGFVKAHAGDLGNIEIAEDGTGHLELTLEGLTLQQGRYGVGGRAVILHEHADDFGQPLGNAGARIGCGLIQIKGAGVKTDGVPEDKDTDNA